MKNEKLMKGCLMCEDIKIKGGRFDYRTSIALETLDSISLLLKKVANGMEDGKDSSTLINASCCLSYVRGEITGEFTQLLQKCSSLKKKLDKQQEKTLDTIVYYKEKLKMQKEGEES